MKNRARREYRLLKARTRAEKIRAKNEVTINTFLSLNVLVIFAENIEARAPRIPRIPQR